MKPPITNISNVSIPAGRSATETLAAQKVRVGGAISATGNDVLKNRLGIENYQQLGRIESKFAAEAEKFRAPMKDMSYQSFKDIHRNNFGEVYEWAGTEREFTTQRGAAPFARPERIQPEMEKLFKELNAENNLKGLSAEKFADRAAHYSNEMNAIHPFIDGNGRVNRAFLGDLANQAGHKLDFSQVTQQEWYAASERGFETADHKSLAALIQKSMGPAQNMEQAPQMSKEVLDYQQTVKDLAANRRNPTVRGELLANERRLASQIAKNPAMLEQARSIGMEKKIRASAAIATQQAHSLSRGVTRGRGI